MCIVSGRITETQLRVLAAKSRDSGQPDSDSNLDICRRLVRSLDRYDVTTKILKYNTEFERGKAEDAQEKHYIVCVQGEHGEYWADPNQDHMDIPPDFGISNVGVFDRLPEWFYGEPEEAKDTE